MRKKPKPISVIDTNVALVANLAASAQTTEILPVDILKCVEIIEETVANKSIVIDDNNEIVNEYSHKLSFKGKCFSGQIVSLEEKNQKQTTHES